MHVWLDSDSKNFREQWTTFVQNKNNTVWEATLHVANSANGEKYLYDIGPIKKVEQSVESDTSTTTNTVPRNALGVNPAENEEDERLSVKDSDGN